MSDFWKPNKFKIFFVIVNAFVLAISFFLRISIFGALITLIPMIVYLLNAPWIILSIVLTPSFSNYDSCYTALGKSDYFIGCAKPPVIEPYILGLLAIFYCYWLACVFYKFYLVKLKRHSPKISHPKS